MLGFLTTLLILVTALTGQVVAVSDGDTLRVTMAGKTEKVRLIGVDCPEVAHGPGDPGQEPWGSRATAFTKKLVLGKTVRLETDVQPRDRYGRLLAYVFVGRTFLNEALIQQGHAVLLTVPPNVKYVERFTLGQKEAQAAKRGIWSPQEPLVQTPSEYRHRSTPKPSAAVSGEVYANLRSRKYHEATCPKHTCPNCRGMKREQAVRDGYEPAADCH